MVHIAPLIASICEFDEVQGELDLIDTNVNTLRVAERVCVRLT